MKGFQYMAFVVVLLMVACDDTAPDACKHLNYDLANYNVEGVKSELNPWLSVLSPQNSTANQYGHEQNLQYFVDRLNAECVLNASIVCYACIETLPPQSEIKVIIDSSGHKIIRVVDIRTPDNDVMTILSIHE